MFGLEKLAIQQSSLLDDLNRTTAQTLKMMAVFLASPEANDPRLREEIAKNLLEAAARIEPKEASVKP